MSTHLPLPVDIVSELPEWLTEIVIPIGAALLAAAIVLFGLWLERQKHDQLRRGAFVDELTQLLIQSAIVEKSGIVGTDLHRARMEHNTFRVRAIASMRKRELPVFTYASGIATKVSASEIDNPQGETALAITRLLDWLTGETKTESFK
jgi:hypothetical protein